MSASILAFVVVRVSTGRRERTGLLTTPNPRGACIASKYLRPAAYAEVGYRCLPA